MITPPVGVPRGPVGTVQKIWGSERWLVNNDLYCGKILYFYGGHAGSLHYHRKKHETFLLNVGSVVVEVGDARHRLYPGDLIDVPAGTSHRITALRDAELWEFSTPHDDDDVVRLEPSRIVIESPNDAILVGL